MDIQSLIKDITNGTVSKEDRNVIMRAIIARREIEKHQIIAINKSTFNEGDKATITGLRPSKLNGLEVEILKIRNVKAEVKMPQDWRAGNYAGKNTIVPLICLVRK